MNGNSTSKTKRIIKIITMRGLGCWRSTGRIWTMCEVFRMQRLFSTRHFFIFIVVFLVVKKPHSNLTRHLIIYHLHSCCCHITHSNRLTLSKTSLKQAHDVLSITLQKNTTSYGPLSSSSRLADGNMLDENENIGYHSYRIYPTINYKTSKQHDDDKGKVSWAKRAELL